MFESLHRLSNASLKALAGLCRQQIDTPPPAYSLQQIVRPATGDELRVCLAALVENGWRMPQVAEIADSIVLARESVRQEIDTFDLVLTGPDVPGIPTRDTAAAMHALLSEAEREVLLVGYAFHNAKSIFEPLAQRMSSEQELRVRFCLDIRRSSNDSSLSSEIVRRFTRQFAEDHWPWLPKPDLYYDPRSLDSTGGIRSSMHAKCVVVDGKAAFVTSANFTSAAHERNIECGVVIRDAHFAGRIAEYFGGLCELKHLLPCHLN